MHRVSSVCRFVLAGGALLAAIACGSLTTSTTTSIPLCNGPLTIDVTFDQTATPSFSWRPVCGISALTVFQGDTTRVWAIAAPERLPFVPGIRYGNAPATATVSTPAQPLNVGATYRVEIISVVGGDGIAARADTSFTVPYPPD